MSIIQQYQLQVENLKVEMIEHRRLLKEWKEHGRSASLLHLVKENIMLIDKEIEVTCKLITTLKNLEHEKRMKKAVKAGQPQYSCLCNTI